MEREEKDGSDHWRQVTAVPIEWSTPTSLTCTSTVSSKLLAFTDLRTELGIASCHVLDCRRCRSGACARTRCLEPAFRELVHIHLNTPLTIAVHYEFVAVPAVVAGALANGASPNAILCTAHNIRIRREWCDSTHFISADTQITFQLVRTWIVAACEEELPEVCEVVPNVSHILRLPRVSNGRCLPQRHPAPCCCCPL